MVKSGDTAGAHTLFDTLLEQRAADKYHLGVMLKVCGSSSEQRALVSRAEACGVLADVSTYTTRLNQLRLEGRADERLIPPFALLVIPSARARAHRLRARRPPNSRNRTTTHRHGQPPPSDTTRTRSCTTRPLRFVRDTSN